EFLKTAAQIEMVHVPYRGGGQALTGLLGGEVQVLFSTLVQILPHVRDGRLKALAVTGERRSPLAPDVPTMVESGFDQLITTSVNVIVAPPGTPLALRRQINQAAAAALASTEVRQAFALLGYETRAASPEEVASYLVEAQHRWSRLIETARLSIDLRFDRWSLTPHRPWGRKAPCPIRRRDRNPRPSRSCRARCPCRRRSFPSAPRCRACA